MKNLLMLFVIGSMLFSCGKEGPKGPQGEPGPDAKTFNFNLTYAVGDTYREYTGITGFDAGDMVITYIFNDEYLNTQNQSVPYYVQTPYTVGNLYIYTEVSEKNGDLYVNINRADGISGSPFVTQGATLSFKAILIKSSAIAKNPNINYANYNEVVNTFNIAE